MAQHTLPDCRAIVTGSCHRKGVFQRKSFEDHLRLTGLAGGGMAFGVRRGGEGW
jgi:hypothetical protein